MPEKTNKNENSFFFAIVFINHYRLYHPTMKQGIHSKAVLGYSVTMDILVRAQV